VIARDPGQRLADRQARRVDVHVLADDAWNRAEPAGHAHGPGIGEGGQAALEHARIELVRLAVDVKERARERRMQQRRAKPGNGQEQLVDEIVFRPPQTRQIEPTLIEKTRRVAAPRMRTVEDERRGQSLRLDDLERLIGFHGVSGG